MDALGTDLRSGWRWVSARWRGELAIGALLGLALLLAGAIAMQRQSAAQRELAAEREVHTVEVLDATSRLRRPALDAMHSEAGYRVTGDERFLRHYVRSLSSMRSGMARLTDLVGDDPGQLERLGALRLRLHDIARITARMSVLEKAPAQATIRSDVRSGQGRRALDSMLIELDRFETVERDRLGQRRLFRQSSFAREKRAGNLLGSAAIVLLLIGTLAHVALRKSLVREKMFRREMEWRAATDELTGLANRRETLAALERQISATNRHLRPLSVAILDIDHFKKVNDTHGHPAGDEVIRRVADLAVEIMREEDLVGRLGGEEFVVILPDMGAPDALAACDRLRQVISRTTVHLIAGEMVSITLSAGVAQMVEGDSSITLIARADEALYDAKEQGRDRVLLAA